MFRKALHYNPSSHYSGFSVRPFRFLSLLQPPSPIVIPTFFLVIPALLLYPSESCLPASPRGGII